MWLVIVSLCIFAQADVLYDDFNIETAVGEGLEELELYGGLDEDPLGNDAPEDLFENNPPDFDPYMEATDDEDEEVTVGEDPFLLMDNPDTPYEDENDFAYMWGPTEVEVGEQDPAYKDSDDSEEFKMLEDDTEERLAAQDEKRQRFKREAEHMLASHVKTHKRKEKRRRPSARSHERRRPRRHGGATMTLDGSFTGNLQDYDEDELAAYPDYEQEVGDYYDAPKVGRLFDRLYDEYEVGADMPDYLFNYDDDDDEVELGLPMDDMFEEMYPDYEELALGAAMPAYLLDYYDNDDYPTKENYADYDDYEQAVGADMPDYLFNYDDNYGEYALGAAMPDYLFYDEDNYPVDDSPEYDDDEDQVAADMPDYLFQYDDDEEQVGADMPEYLFEYNDDEEGVGLQYPDYLIDEMYPDEEGVGADMPDYLFNYDDNYEEDLAADMPDYLFGYDDDEEGVGADMPDYLFAYEDNNNPQPDAEEPVEGLYREDDVGFDRPRLSKTMRDFVNMLDFSSEEPNELEVGETAVNKAEIKKDADKLANVMEDVLGDIPHDFRKIAGEKIDSLDDDKEFVDALARKLENPFHVDELVRQAKKLKKNVKHFFDRDEETLSSPNFQPRVSDFFGKKRDEIRNMVFETAVGTPKGEKLVSQANQKDKMLLVYFLKKVLNKLPMAVRVLFVRRFKKRYQRPDLRNRMLDIVSKMRKTMKAKINTAGFKDRLKSMIQRIQSRIGKRFNIAKAMLKAKMRKMNSEADDEPRKIVKMRKNHGVTMMGNRGLEESQGAGPTGKYPVAKFYGNKPVVVYYVPITASENGLSQLRKSLFRKKVQKKQ